MTTQIVILGAGYAGLLMAMRLGRTTRGLDTQVTLVNDSPYFADRIRQHQLATRAHAPRPIEAVLRGSSAAFVCGRAAAIDPGAHTVTVRGAAQDRVLHYDRLIYALGSYTDMDSVPGVRQHAQTLSQQSVDGLRAALPALAARNGRVLVVGGGLTGIEAATEFAETYPGLRVTLASAARVGDDLSERARAYIAAACARLGVTVLEGARVDRLWAGHAETAQGSLSFDLCLWTSGFAVPDLARRAGLPVNARGQVLVDATFRTATHPEVYAVGDAAAFTEDVGAAPRLACATSMLMAAHAAGNLLADLMHAPLTAFRLAYAGKCVSLGRADGLYDLSNADDTPKNKIYSGRVGRMIKHLIVSLVWRQMGWERYTSGVYGAVSAGARRMALTASV